MRQFAGARQMQTGCPGPGAGSGHAGQRGSFGVNMWRVGVPKAWLVASICFSKSLSGSFTHVSACMCLQREGETHSLSAGSLRALPWEWWDGELGDHPTLPEQRAVEKAQPDPQRTPLCQHNKHHLGFSAVSGSKPGLFYHCPAFPRTKPLFQV